MSSNPWFLFTASAFVIIVSGLKLTHLGKVIAERTGLGGAVVGALFIAGITSLPELIIVASSAMIAAPELGIGNIFGSNSFNLLFLPVIDLFQGRGPLFFELDIAHMLPGLVGLLLSVLAVFGIVFGLVWGSGASLGHLDPFSLIILAAYLLGTMLIYRFGCRVQNGADLLPEDTGPDPEGDQPVAGGSDFNTSDGTGGADVAGGVCGAGVNGGAEGESGRGSGEGESGRGSGEGEKGSEGIKNRAEPRGPQLILVTLITTAAVVWGGATLARTGSEIAQVTGLGETFVGSIFIAFSTSLPELVGTFGAVRFRSYDLAVGNILGSNIFNILIIVVADIFYRGGPVLGTASPVNILPGLTVVLLTCVVLIGLFYRSRRSILFLGWDSLAIFTIFVLNALLLLTVG